MFNGGFNEAHERSATLPEDTPDAFDILLRWVYTGVNMLFKWTKTIEGPR